MFSKFKFIFSIFLLIASSNTVSALPNETSEDKDFTKFIRNGIMSREDGIRLFSGLRAIGGGGSAIVYRMENDRVLRVSSVQRSIYCRQNKVIAALKKIKKKIKTCR